MEVFIPEEQSSAEHENEFDCHCEDCIKDKMASKQDTVAIPNEPLNDSQANNPVF